MTFNIHWMRALAWKLMLPMLSILLLLGSRAALADEDFLPPEKAFHPTVRMADAHTAEVRFDIADGYYLYRQRFAFKARGAGLGDPQIPAGAMHFDDTLQRSVETYRKSVVIHIAVAASGPFTLDVTAQGCAEKGLCYPPMTTSTALAPGPGTGKPAAGTCC